MVSFRIRQVLFVYKKLFILGKVTLKKSNGSHYCGGSILSSLKIMTTATCHQTTVSGCKAGAGSVRINSQRQTKTLATQIKHPEFNAQLIDFDFMIVSVSSPFKFDKYTAPVKLPAIEEDELPMHTPVMSFSLFRAQTPL